MNDPSVLSDNVYLAKGTWNDKERRKKALLTNFLAVQTDPAAIVAAAIDLQNDRLLAKHSGDVIRFVAANKDIINTPECKAISKARIDWSLEEIAKMPTYFLDCMKDNYESPDWIQMALDREKREESEDFSRDNPQASYAELFWVKVLMYRSDVDPTDIFPVYIKHVDPRVMHVPFGVTIFTSISGDLLDQVDQYYRSKAVLSPMITCRRNVQLLRDDQARTLTPYMDTCWSHWYTSTVYIETPYACYLFPSKVEIDVTEKPLCTSPVSTTTCSRLP